MPHFLISSKNLKSAKLLLLFRNLAYGIEQDNRFENVYGEGGSPGYIDEDERWYTHDQQELGHITKEVAALQQPLSTASINPIPTQSALTSSKIEWEHGWRTAKNSIVAAHFLQRYTNTVLQLLSSIKF